MKNVIYLLTLTILFTVFSCEEPVDEKLVVGSCATVAFLENNTPLDVDLKSINFSFYENNTYTYQGLMNLEAGNYYLSRKLLYTIDTLSDNRIEKSVKVIKSTADSLFFEMNSGGDTQIIKLYKTD